MSTGKWVLVPGLVAGQAMLSACDRDLEVTVAVQAALIAELRAANAQPAEANAALGLPARLTCIRI